MKKPVRWPKVDQVRRRQELMDRMMERLGVDVLTAVRLDRGQAFIEARIRCRDCLHEGKCRLWLDQPPRVPLPPSFCPNAQFFSACGLLGRYGLWRESRKTRPAA